MSKEGKDGFIREESALWSVRPAQTADLNALVRLEQRAMAEPWSVAILQDELSSPMAVKGDRSLSWPLVWVLSEEPGIELREKVGRKVGAYLSAHLVWDELQLYRIAVEPQLRRKGLGRRLLLAVMAYSRELGAETVTLEVRETNWTAQAFYRSLGFAEQALRPRYYTDTGEAALIMGCRMDNDGNSGLRKIFTEI